MRRKEWRKYICESGDAWEIFLDDDAVETSDDLQCRHDRDDEHHETTFGFRHSPTDIVVILIIPSERIVDDVTNQVGMGGTYYLKLELMNGDDWFYFSRKSYNKDEIVVLASFFIGLNRKQAERVWVGKKLGELNSYRLEKTEKS